MHALAVLDKATDISIESLPGYLKKKEIAARVAGRVKKLSLKTAESRWELVLALACCSVLAQWRVLS